MKEMALSAAANQLNAFINEVSAQQGKKIADDVAVMLIARAQALLEKIEAWLESKEAVPVAAEETEVFETMSPEEPQNNELPTSAETATRAN